MSWSINRFGKAFSALLFALLISAQTLSIAHAYEHDPGSLGETACTTCASFGQHIAVAVDTGQPVVQQGFSPIRRGACALPLAGRIADQARQRGPPARP
jgi:hypothetical protein